MAKRNPRMEALAAEAAAEQRIGPEIPHDPGQAAPAPGPMPGDDHSGLVEFCRVPVMLAGGALCGGYGVTPLAPEEADRVANALAGVLVANGVTIRDPRIMSAMVLGGAIAQVAAPRVLEYRARDAKRRDDIEAARSKPAEPQANAEAA